MKQFEIKDLINFKKGRLMEKIQPYTMVTPSRLSNIYDLCTLVRKNDIKGSFVECGVYKGGCAGIMAYIAKEEGRKRKTWLFDSFEGLPQPTNTDGENAKRYAEGKTRGKLSSIKKCVGTLKDVKRLFFSILELDEKDIIIRKGWFQNTIPKAKEEMGPIAILRLDADWYESTKVCLENLYDNVVKGGYIILDDYGYWEGCKKATDEFLKKKKLKVRLIKIDGGGIYFRKI